MNNEFVSYEVALTLKKLGFDEPCLAFYDGENNEHIFYNNDRNGTGDYKPIVNNERLKWFGAPLYQQALRWIRENYDINVFCTFDIAMQVGIIKALKLISAKQIKTEIN